MQDYREQAEKNGIKIRHEGPCQFCGACVMTGIEGCIEQYSYGLKHLDLNEPLHHLPRFLSVDAHALQHPEIHGRWSNHFHLTRLYLILDRNTDWDYKRSSALSTHLNNYKKSHPEERLQSPETLKRGRITCLDLIKTNTADEIIKLIRSWAEEVYKTWHKNHAAVSVIGDTFLLSYNDPTNEQNKDK